MNSKQEKIVSTINKFKKHALSLTKNKFDADDLISDFYLLLDLRYKNISKFSGKEYDNYAYRMLYNLFVQNKMNKKSQKLLYTDTIENYDGKYEIFDNKPNNDVLNEIISTKVSEIKKSMNNMYSEPLALFTKGYSYRAIANELNLSINTVKTRIRRARIKLEENKD